MQLTEKQALSYAHFAEQAVKVRSELDFRSLVANHVLALMPHGILFAAIGQLDFQHLVVHRYIAIGYPEWALKKSIQPINVSERPILQRWLHTRAPIVACPIEDRALMSTHEIQEIEAIGLGRLAIHGVPDLANRMGSYFSFAQVPQCINRENIEIILAIMAPLLHVALCLATRNQEEKNFLHTLTEVERDLLAWLTAGRSNQEIATLRKRSVATIRNQLVRLYSKMGVSTRAEAVGLSLRQAEHIAPVKDQ
ncbi:helix-turn-helix transcriptional regulator [Ralstonia solanacearum species complex bacterium KE056]|uniref:helix-turn-helix transcriptional regulator n=1 Tax=Ralstonia solanacearum species complex bacterium KE056 TaxID=3119585 RepID=UPI002FC2F208